MPPRQQHQPPPLSPPPRSGGGGINHRIRLALLIISYFGVASVTMLLMKVNSLSSNSGSVDGEAASFSAPKIDNGWSLSDRYRYNGEVNDLNGTRSKLNVIREREAEAAANAKDFTDTETISTSTTASQVSGGMHICTCLTSNNNNHHNPNPPLNPTTPKRIRWLHIPKTGTSFISTLWSYAASTSTRYIDLNVDSYFCSPDDTAAQGLSMYDFVLMRRYPWEMYGAQNMIPPKSSSQSTITNSNGKAREEKEGIHKDMPLGLVGGTQHQPLTANLKDDRLTSSSRFPHIRKQMKAWGSELYEHNFTVAAFFRQPQERIVSAFYDGRHANGFKPETWKALVSATSKKKLSPEVWKGLVQSKSKQQQQQQQQLQPQCTIQKQAYHNPLECFARYPGIAGCMTRMLTGETCADGILQKDGMENVPLAVEVVNQKLEFVGLTEEWNESVCQFHKLFSAKQQTQLDDGKRQSYWDRMPLQGEFSNVHKSSKKKEWDVRDLHGFVDVADTVVYEAAKLKFERMVMGNGNSGGNGNGGGGGRCYRYMTWEELKMEKTRKDTSLENENGGFLDHLTLDEEGNVCVPKSCSDLGKQCGEWDDGCGKTIICGMCSKGRTGLPATWRVKCVQGQCIDYCPTWDERGYWFLAEGGDNNSNNDKTFQSSVTLKKAMRALGKDPEQQTYLSPVDAVEICEVACTAAKKQRQQKSLPRKGNNHDTTQSIIPDGFHNIVHSNPPLCKCGTTKSKILNKNLTLHDFSKAHNLNESCKTNKARKEAILQPTETQPICCPELRLPPKTPLPPGWKRLFSMGRENLEGDYFHYEPMECGSFVECEEVGRTKGAELAVLDIYNSMCYLARNVVDLGDWFTVTKDNHNRFAIDLRI